MLNQFNETLFKLLWYEQAMELMVTFSSTDALRKKDMEIFNQYLVNTELKFNGPRIKNCG